MTNTIAAHGSHLANSPILLTALEELQQSLDRIVGDWAEQAHHRSQAHRDQVLADLSTAHDLYYHFAGGHGDATRCELDGATPCDGHCDAIIRREPEYPTWIDKPRYR